MYISAPKCTNQFHQLRRASEDANQRTMSYSLNSIERSNPPPRRKACVACIKSKRRCNLGRPTCLRCSHRQIQCRYQSEQNLISMHHSPQTANDTTIAEPMEIFHTAEKSTIEFAFAIPDPAEMHLSYSSQPICSRLDHVSSESLISDSLEIDDFSGNVFHVDPVQDLVQSPTHLVPSRTKQLEILNEAIKRRLQYAIDQLKDSPRRMVLENETSWSHPLLYCSSIPRNIQDAQACSALYLAKNNVNAPVVLSILSSRATELASQPISSSPREVLARTQALMLYSIMRLFDGDLQALKLAEEDMSALESAALALLPLITFPDSDSAKQPLSLYPISTTREFWNDWIFQESARRTFFMVFFYMQIYRLLCSVPTLPCDGKLHLCHSWTMSAHLWGAKDTLEFAEAWVTRKQFVVSNAKFDDILNDAMAEDIDDYAKILMTAVMGIDEFKGWMISRGERLHI